MDDFIEVYDGAISPKDCKTIIEKFERSPHRTPGVVANGLKKDKKDSTDITISDYPDWKNIDDNLTNCVYSYIEKYINKYRVLLAGAMMHTVSHPLSGGRTEITLENFDEVGVPYLPLLVRHAYRLGRINVQKYDRSKGGYHHWHSEIYQDADSIEPLERVLLFQFYLNDVQDGGETDFMYQSRRISARTGRLVIAPAGFTHTHKGHIPQSHDKFVATSWVLFQRPEVLYRRARR